MLPMCKEVKCWSFSTLSIVSQRCVREKKNFVAAIFMVNFLPRCARNIKATNFRHMNMMSNSPIKGVFFSSSAVIQPQRKQQFLFLVYLVFVFSFGNIHLSSTFPHILLLTCDQMHFKLDMFQFIVTVIFSFSHQFHYITDMHLVMCNGR